MCANAYKKKCTKNGTTMIFCNLINSDEELRKICIHQKYCDKKNEYIPSNQEQCRNYV